MAPGWWRLGLQRGCPWLDDIREFGMVCVTGGPVASADPDTILAQSIYTGVLNHDLSNDLTEFTGAGACVWMGDEDGKGDIDASQRNLDTADSGSSVNLTEIIGNLVDYCNGVTVGTVKSVGNVVGVIPRGMTARQWLTESFTFGVSDTDTIGLEWRLNHDLTLDVNDPDQLFADGAVLLTGDGRGHRTLASGLEVVGCEPLRIASVNVENYATGEVWYDRDADAGAEADNSTPTTYYAPDGSTIRWRRPRAQNASEPLASLGWAIVLLIIIDTITGEVEREIDVTTEAASTQLHRIIRPGDWVRFWDPTGRLVDLNETPLYLDGQLVWPMRLRCTAIEWSAPPTSGVYHLTPDATPTVIDLTPWVAWDNSAPRLEVGKPPPNILDAIGGTT